MYFSTAPGTQRISKKILSCQFLHIWYWQQIKKLENPVHIFLHNFAHNSGFSKTLTLSSIPLLLKMTNHFYFCYSNNDEANNAAGAMMTLDYNLATHVGVSEIFYGYRRHGDSFIIEGMVHFAVDIADNEIHHLLHGFEVRRYDFIQDVYTLIGRVTAISLFTKHGNSWDYGWVQFHHQNLFDHFNSNM